LTVVSPFDRFDILGTVPKELPLACYFADFVGSPRVHDGRKPEILKHYPFSANAAPFLSLAMLATPVFVEVGDRSINFLTLAKTFGAPRVFPG
jgi:hypothetical protein